MSDDDAAVEKGVRKKHGKKAAKRRISDQDPMDKAIIDLLEKDKERDEIDSFFDSCVHRVKKLPNSMKSVVQMQVSQIIFNAENPMMQQPVMAIPMPQVPQQMPQPASQLMPQPSPQPMHQSVPLAMGSSQKPTYATLQNVSTDGDILSQAMNVIY